VLQGGVTALDDDPLAAYDQPFVWAKPRRQSLKGTGLRNETILNKVQDEIFRLPMSRQVMLEGPPGTGKTSTLIKRLAQKLALTKDSIEDFRLVEENSLGVAHRDSWIMFSPTQLLEHYLVQAFADNNVPSGQKRVQTWADFRNDLATRVLGLLRSGGRKTGFLREEYEPYLSPRAMEDQPGLHAALDRFLAETSRAELDGALGLLTTSGETALVDAAQRIVNRLPAGFSILAIHLAVDAQSDALRNWVNGARAALRTDVARWIDVVARRRSADIPALREIVARMNASDTDSDEDEDEDDGLEPEAAPTTTGESLRRALRGAIRAQAMAAWTARAVTRTSIFRPVIEWLGEQAVAEADLRAMGRLHALIAAAGRVTLVTRNDARMIADIEKLIKKKIEIEPLELDDERPRRVRRRDDDALGARDEGGGRDERRETHAARDARERRRGEHAAVRAPGTARAMPADPFFDRPYEPSGSGDAAWEKGAAVAAAPVKPAATGLRPKRRVASLLGGGH
jgi:hypothetical protein